LRKLHSASQRLSLGLWLALVGPAIAN
jgi:hypothetical protein